jgi:hypothetical protein
MIFLLNKNCCLMINRAFIKVFGQLKNITVNVTKGNDPGQRR